MTALYASGYAKLNLFLNVLGKREDGYHNIESVMQAITLRDDMEIQIGTGEHWCIDSDRDDVPRNEDNLCWKAAERFFASISDGRYKAKSFSNARLARNLYERVWAKAATRHQLNKDAPLELLPEDLTGAVEDQEFQQLLKTPGGSMGFAATLETEH